MSLPTPVLGRIGSQSFAVPSAALFVPFALAVLVYLDDRRRRGGSRSLTPLTWGAATFYSGAGCLVVTACYVAVRGR